MTDFNRTKTALINGETADYDYQSTDPDYAAANLKSLGVKTHFLGTGQPLTVHGDTWAGDDQLRYFWRVVDPVPVFSGDTVARYDVQRWKGNKNE